MLQQASSKKHFPQQYSHSTEPPQRPQDIQNKWVEVGSKISSLLFRGRWEDPGLREAEPVKSEGIADTTYWHESRLGSLNNPS